MNRGSALKWIEQLRLCEDLYDNSQLGFSNNGIVYISPIGVLCRFIMKDEFKLNSLCLYHLENQCFTPSKELMKRCKIKHGWMFLKDEGKAKLCDLEADYSFPRRLLTEVQLEDCKNNLSDIPRYVTLYKKLDEVNHSISSNSKEYSKHMFDRAAQVVEEYYEDF